MTIAEKIFEKVMFDYQHNDFDDPELQMIHEAMKQAAWEAWNFSCEAFYKLNGMPYTDKQIEIERQAFEIFWSEELKENDK